MERELAAALLCYGTRKDRPEATAEVGFDLLLTRGLIALRAAGFYNAAIDGAFGPAPQARFVLTGNANLDPFDGEGRHAAIRALLADPRLHDPKPRSDGAAAAPDQGHAGPNALDTVDWPRAGRLRVDYVLPSRDLTVTASGVHWPAPGQPGHAQMRAASRHRLVWVDLALE